MKQLSSSKHKNWFRNKWRRPFGFWKPNTLTILKMYQKGRKDLRLKWILILFLIEENPMQVYICTIRLAFIYSSFFLQLTFCIKFPSFQKYKSKPQTLMNCKRAKHNKHYTVSSPSHDLLNHMNHLHIWFIFTCTLFKLTWFIFRTITQSSAKKKGKK